MSILITFIKLLAVFDLLVIAVYFGSDILSTVWSKFRKSPHGRNLLISPWMPQRFPCP